MRDPVVRAGEERYCYDSKEYIKIANTNMYTQVATFGRKK